MDEKDAKQKMKEGWIHAIVTFEIAGNPKEHVEKALESYLENLKKDERIEILQQESEEAEEHEDGVFSAFAEIDLIIDKLDTFTWLCINFTPASIEVIEPDTLKMDARTLTNWYNDLLAKLHEVSSVVRQHSSANEHIIVAMNQLIRNSIILSIKTGEKTKDQITKDTGIQDVQLDEFLTHLIEKNKITEDKGKYKIA
ncbi:hypothetical protein GOV11_01100 [Candidatus Woesearchaeota archaeon]|nr:hypothetical protein [Candidatus Woesearchaeota archaeon]